MCSNADMIMTLPLIRMVFFGVATDFLSRPAACLPDALAKPSDMVRFVFLGGSDDHTYIPISFIIALFLQSPSKRKKKHFSSSVIIWDPLTSAFNIQFWQAPSTPHRLSHCRECQPHQTGQETKVSCSAAQTLPTMA